MKLLYSVQEFIAGPSCDYKKINMSGEGEIYGVKWSAVEAANAAAQPFIEKIY